MDDVIFNNVNMNGHKVIFEDRNATNCQSEIHSSLYLLLHTLIATTIGVVKSK